VDVPQANNIIKSTTGVTNIDSVRVNTNIDTSESITQIRSSPLVTGSTR